MIKSEDLFADGPPPWAPRKHPRYADRRPGVYLAVTRADDRALLCTVAVTMLDEHTRGPVDLLEFIARVTTEASSLEQRARLAALLNSADLHDLSAFIGRVRERRAQIEGTPR